MTKSLAQQLADTQAELTALENLKASGSPVDTEPTRAKRDSIARYMAEADEPRNPVVRTTALNAYPGWAVREYQDGTFDSTEVEGLGLSPGCDSFTEAVAFARDEREAAREDAASLRSNDDYRAEAEAESRFGDEDYRRDVRGFNDDSPYDHGAGGGDPDDGWD